MSTIHQTRQITLLKHRIKTFKFKDAESKEVKNVSASNLEAARKKLERLVSTPQNWKKV